MPVQSSGQAGATRRAFLKASSRLAAWGAFTSSLNRTAAGESQIEFRQITQGPRHHFFGYIGHVQTVPWNQSGRYLVALRVSFQDHLPRPDEPAEIVLLDTDRDFSAEVVAETRAWNPQQGTMLYWNPDHAETQFVFNDRDPRTNQIFAVLFDTHTRQRKREFRFDDTPVGNGGVCQTGQYFAGINYARMARLRPVTGYVDARDWTGTTRHPTDDGVFRISLESGEKRLLISFAQLADLVRPHDPRVDRTSLYINHTLWNREGDRLFFFVRGNDGQSVKLVNVPIVMNSDGSNPRVFPQFIGGHPEWLPGRKMVGARDGRQIVFDTDRMEIVATLGTREQLFDPEGDIALSPDGRWLVNGAHRSRRNVYGILRLADGHFLRGPELSIGDWTSGDLRLDPAPLWSRDSRQLLLPGLDASDGRTRQLFLATLPRVTGGS